MNPKHQTFICTEFQLGMPVGVATSVYGCRGGSFMWRVNTEKGSYAIRGFGQQFTILAGLDLTS